MWRRLHNSEKLRPTKSYIVSGWKLNPDTVVTTKQQQRNGQGTAGGAGRLCGSCWREGRASFRGIICRLCTVTGHLRMRTRPEKRIVRRCHHAEVAACPQALRDASAAPVCPWPRCRHSARTVSSVVKWLLFVFVRFLIFFLLLRLESFFVSNFRM